LVTLNDLMEVVVEVDGFASLVSIEELEGGEPKLTCRLIRARTMPATSSSMEEWGTLRTV
jgi:hypothetical protein